MRIGDYERRVIGVFLSRGGVIGEGESTAVTSDGARILPLRYKAGYPKGWFDAAYHRKVLDRMVKKGLLVREPGGQWRLTALALPVTPPREMFPEVSAALKRIVDLSIAEEREDERSRGGF